MKSRYAVVAEMFKALGDENRIKLMEELKEGEKNAGELLETLSVSQPTLSHHMKILCDSGIVEARKDGKWTYYSISEDGKEELLDIINSFTATVKRKPSLKIEDIVISEIAAADKPAKKKATAKKSAKKKKETNPDIVKETYTPPHTAEEDKLWDKPEEIEEIEEIEEESTGETRSSMPSWLF